MCEMQEEMENIELKPSNSRKSGTRNNAGRQSAVNFMPSRQLPHSESHILFKSI